MDGQKVKGKGVERLLVEVEARVLALRAVGVDEVAPLRRRKAHRAPKESRVRGEDLGSDELHNFGG